MHSLSRILGSRLLLAALCASLVAPSLLAQTSVRTVKVLASKNAVEIEVEASDRIVPQAQVLTGPDRLVVDFPNAVPSNQLRSQSVDRGEVKDLRIGLFQSKPPITRVVIDLKSAQSYQVFPSGRTVIIKIMGGAADTSARVDNSAPASPTRPGLVVANYTTRAEPVRVEPPATPKLEVTFHNGLLGIRANKATLSEVLFAVQQRTGAEVSIAAGAELEKVVAEIVPGPAPEVLARLLNGSNFNFLIVSAVNDPRQLDRVILSTRAGGEVEPLAPLPMQNATPDAYQSGIMRPPPDDDAPEPVQSASAPQAEVKPSPDDGPPDQ